MRQDQSLNLFWDFDEMFNLVETASIFKNLTVTLKYSYYDAEQSL